MYIFNQSNDVKFQQYYEDEIYKHEDGTGFGTRVIIKIPKIHHYVS